jgi:hypothetical protein
VGTDEHSNSHSKKEHPVFQQEVAQDYRDYSAPGLDSLHWAGVKKRGDFDQRSVASSMNAERDDQSIYEQPGIGAVEGKKNPEQLLSAKSSQISLRLLPKVENVAQEEFSYHTVFASLRYRGR